MTGYFRSLRDPLRSVENHLAVRSPLRGLVFLPAFPGLRFAPSWANFFAPSGRGLYVVKHFHHASVDRSRPGELRMTAVIKLRTSDSGHYGLGRGTMGLHLSGRRVVSQVRSWWRAATRRKWLESDMESELSHHLECVTADLVGAGMAPEEAARRARLALGSALVQKEEMRASVGLRWWDELRSDVQYGLRILRKSPGFTAIAAGSLALAIGANTTIVSIAKRALLDRLDASHPEQ